MDIRNCGSGWPVAPAKRLGGLLRRVDGFLVFLRPGESDKTDDAPMSHSSARLCAVGWPRAVLAYPAPVTAANQDLVSGGAPEVGTASLTAGSAHLSERDRTDMVRDSGDSPDYGDAGSHVSRETRTGAGVGSRAEAVPGAPPAEARSGEGMRAGGSVHRLGRFLSHVARNLRHDTRRHGGVSCQRAGRARNYRYCLRPGRKTGRAQSRFTIRCRRSESRDESRHEVRATEHSVPPATPVRRHRGYRGRYD